MGCGGSKPATANAETAAREAPGPAEAGPIAGLTLLDTSQDKTADLTHLGYEKPKTSEVLHTDFVDIPPLRKLLNSGDLALVKASYLLDVGVRRGRGCGGDKGWNLLPGR